MSVERAISRVVVKVGSAVVAPSGRVDLEALARICDDLAGLRAGGVEVVLVSSGAVASGFRALGLAEMPRSIREKQASAAIGQPALMRAYVDRLGARSITAAQVLLTADDFAHRARFLNARHTLETLVRASVIPVVNENDSVVMDELKLGDNDRLSALVATAIDADLLVLLSVAPGLLDSAQQIIPRVTNLAEAERFVVPASSSGVGTGGMTTKLEAARIVTEHGIPAVLTRGPTADLPDPVSRVVGGSPLGTRFEPAQSGGSAVLRARKSWIAYATKPQGELVVDNGAARAIVQRGASLLPKGIVRINGHFGAGVGVSIVDEAGHTIARGLVSYSSEEINKIKGLRSEEIAGTLGYAYAEEVVHRDDLQLVGSAAGGRS